MAETSVMVRKSWQRQEKLFLCVVSSDATGTMYHGWPASSEFLNMRQNSNVASHLGRLSFYYCVSLGKYLFFSDA